MKYNLRNSASVLLAFSVISVSTTFIKGQEPNRNQSQTTTQQPVAPIASEAAKTETKTDLTPTSESTTPNVSTNPTTAITSEEKPVTPPVAINPVTYTATAYSLRGKTASGRLVSRGLIAADPRVLPLGSRVRLDAGDWSGEYLVADTGGAVKGRRIDIWTPTAREAFRFGRRAVKVTILSLGLKRSPSNRAGKKRSATPAPPAQ